MKYEHDYLFNADLKDPCRKIWTVGDMERKAKDEDEAPMKGSLRHYLRPKKESWFDKLLNYIYE